MSERTSETRPSRREFLRATAAGTTAAAAGLGATGTATAQSGDQFGGWLSDDDSFDGTIADETGASNVTVAVGAEGNNGSNAFDPSAVRVDPGTTVTWEWTGNGSHNVVASEGGDFESELTDSGDYTFEQTFEEEGVVKYYCNPHRSLGMKGVVVVGDPDLGGSGAESGGHGGEEEGSIVFTPELQAMGAAIVLGILSPIVFAVLLVLNRDKVEPKQDGRGDSNLKRIDSDGNN